MTAVGRVFFCPSCGARYDVAREHVESNALLLCGTCGNAAHVGDAPAAAEAEAKDKATNVHAAAEKPDAPMSDADKAMLDALLPRVIVGHEVPAAARSIATVLRRAGYAPVCVRSGELVLSACDPAMPAPAAAVILDVAIPGVLAFEVIEQLRAHPATKGVPVVLLASVFERTRYKRRPTNLYGADAYLELHHVPDRLAPLIDEVRAKKVPDPDHRVQAPVERARAAGLRARPDADDVDAAQALARRLLSDVALYHGDELADGVRRGNPFASLGSAVDNARELFRAASRAQTVFEDELARFGQHLLERSGGRRADG